jgi:hypothetical protein
VNPYRSIGKVFLFRAKVVNPEAQIKTNKVIEVRSSFEYVVFVLQVVEYDREEPLGA